MRKVFLSFLLCGVLLGGFAKQAQAQDKNLEFHICAGALTDTHFEYFFITLEAGLDFHLGKSIMLSPEVQTWTYTERIGFDEFLLNPGLILNFKSKNFFIGGGIILSLFSIDEDIKLDNLMLKANAGFRMKNIRLTIYVIPLTEEDIFDVEGIALGANIGFVF